MSLQPIMLINMLESQVVGINNYYSRNQRKIDYLNKQQNYNLRVINRELSSKNPDYKLVDQCFKNVDKCINESLRLDSKIINRNRKKSKRK